MYIGLDIGSSGTKAGLYNRLGQEIGFSKVSYTFDVIGPDIREFKGSTFYNAALAVLREVMKQYKAKNHSEKIKNITISSLGEAVAPVDKEFNLLHNFVAGSDTRKNPNQNKYTIDTEEVAEITGLSYGELYSGFKIAWLKNKIDITKLYKWLNVQDYIIARLSGEPYIDYSMASRTSLFDITSKRWSPNMLEYFEVPEKYLPKAVLAGTVVGLLKKSLKNLIGIDYDIEIVIGTHDHISNALGSGVVTEGTACNTVGTTEGFTMMLNKRLTTSQIIESGISSEPSVKNNLYNTVAWHNTAGATIDWFVRNFGNKNEGYIEFENKCLEKPSGLVVKPLFSGQTIPYIDSSIRGSIYGLGLETTKYQIYQGLLEGCSFELKKIYEILLRNKIEISTLVVTGGGSKSNKWNQIKSDVLDKKIYVTKYKENGTLGSAMLGAVAAREYINIEDAVDKMSSSYEIIHPLKENVEIYNQLFEEYKKL